MVMDSDVSRTQKIIRILLQSCIFPLVSPSDRESIIPTLCVGHGAKEVPKG